MSLLGSSQMASPDREKADSAAASARALVDAIARRSEAARHHHAQVDRKRDRAGDGDRRLDQRGAALPRDRRRAAEVEWTIDDFERVRQQRAGAVRSQAFRALRRRRFPRAPAACRRC